MTDSFVRTYDNPSACLVDAVAFFQARPVYAPVRDVARDARQHRIEMSGHATDATSDYLGNHLGRLSAKDIQDEIDFLDLKIADFTKLDYAWAETIVYDLEGTRMVLADALAEKIAEEERYRPDPEDWRDDE